MNTEHSIPRKPVELDPNSFTALRKEGIRLVQEMSGDIWTDYNLHDPGVTILEQLCYALTDLIYRSDFSVEDLLTGDDGKIAYPQQALHLPEEILPCRSWTVADYQQTILDSCPDADNVWFEASTAVCPRLAATCPGVYAATVRLFSSSAHDSIKADIKRCFVDTRNLCEDIHDSVGVLDNLVCDLLGTVEIDGSQVPGHVLGEIYHRAVLYIASNVQLGQSHDSSEEAVGVIDFFTGPRVRHERIPTDDTANPDKVLLANLVGIVLDIPGVVRVHDLKIRVRHQDGTRTYSETVHRRHGNAALWLRVPRSGSLVAENDAETRGITLVKNGKNIAAPVDDAWHKFYQLITAMRAARAKKMDLTSYYFLPQGVKRDVGDYYSIQNHFPDTYGINANGVPASAPPERRAQARQLKAYLILFEQIMANHLANVDGVRELFAKAIRAGQTYRYQALRDRTITGAQLEINNEPGKFLKSLLSEFDDSAERKNRQLDHMLAVFGEEFLQKSLRHFNYYSPTQDPSEESRRNKAAFLRNIVKITRDRVAAPNYLTGESAGGFAKRVGLLLGFRQQGGSLTAAMLEKDVEPGSSTDVVDPCDAGPRVGDMPGFAVPAMGDGAQEYRDDAQKIFQDPELARRLLADGTNIENYRLVSEGSDNSLSLNLGCTAGGFWIALRKFTCQNHAEGVAKALQRLSIALCRRSEGLHVVEHVLLRPAAGREKHAGDQQAGWDTLHGGQVDLWQDFYPLRFSVFFPDWTARCRDSAFRELAEETVRVNSPAHVYGQCFWLDFKKMCRLEKLLRQWSAARQLSDTPASELDCRAIKLIDFCLSCRAEQH